MIYIKTDWDVPYYNMALENYIMTEDKFDDDYMLFYVHKPSVVIGKFQNAFEEINRRFIDDKDIILSRRISGGGAVYHDEGNLNFSFIKSNYKHKKIDYAEFTMPVIKALNAMGIKAYPNERNDIMLDNKKISGNAQARIKDKVLHHGTLLYNSDLDNLANALYISDTGITSKAIKSVRSKVCNICDYYNADSSIDEFKNKLIYYMGKADNISKYKLTADDISAVEKLVNNRFGTWEYNYGRSPKFTVKKKKQMSWGTLNVETFIVKGMIDDINISGESIVTDREILQNNLIGIAYRVKDISFRINKISTSDYIQEISGEEFLMMII